ncbi:MULTISPECIES: hypothetical protein [unclassified Pseudarthrobacter]|uniref:hypothetical protein n=1 Tax=unclassified Pseudarthrobacter TaxID=2647000 RepID=UPI003CC64DCC
MTRAGRGKVAMATAALGISLLSVAGCGYINPQQTTHQYSSSDGIRADVGPLQLRNILIVSTGGDEPGRVIGAVYNSSSEDVKLTITGAEGSETQIPVPAKSHTLLNESADEAILDTTGDIPGSLVDVKVVEDATNVEQTVRVPVVDGTLPEYQPYLPEGSTPTETASPTGSSTESADPHATESASAGH